MAGRGLGRKRRKAALPSRGPHRFPAGSRGRGTRIRRRDAGRRSLCVVAGACLRDRASGGATGAAFFGAGGPRNRHLDRRANLYQHRREHGRAAHQGVDASAVVFWRQRDCRQLPRARDPDARRLRESKIAAGLHRMTDTVMITTGGTGGHIFPGLAVASRLVAKGCKVFWLGTRDGIEARLVPQHGVDFEAIRFGGVRGKGLKRLLLGPFSLLLAFWQSLRVIRRRAPDVVLGLGGFASFPGALMGVAWGRPLAIHDANAVAGLANRILAFGADRILLGFPDALRGRHAAKVQWVGNPLRDDIVAVARPEQRFAGRKGPLKLLVLGGSLGAVALNQRVPSALALLAPSQRPQVTHQAGDAHLEALRRAYAEAGAAAECVAFIADMASRYAEADLVICRGGP